jgi:hypothetical protein
LCGLAQRKKISSMNWKLKSAFEQSRMGTDI